MELLQDATKRNTPIKGRRLITAAMIDLVMSASLGVAGHQTFALRIS